jgi:glycogen synthase
MRVLMLSWEYPPHMVGGLGRHVMCLAPALVEQGVSVCVLTPLLRDAAPYEQTAAGVHVHRVAVPNTQEQGSVAFAQEANVLLANAAHELQRDGGDFALIHAHDWLVAGTAVALKHVWRRPLIATIHATERGRMQGNLATEHSVQINQIEWALSYESWRVIACSRFMAAQVGEYFRAPADKIDVVPNGVPIAPSPFATATERRAFRRTIVADGEQLVFYVGRAVYEKGLHVLLDAWPQVHAEAPRAKLVIAGTGGQLEALKQQAQALGLEQVVFAGFISDADRDRLYHVADVAVFPSLYEPFGIVALEAMAAGCPVVASATGGLAEVVRSHETGLAVQPNNPDSLAWGVLHALRYPAWSHERAASALREVETHYSWLAVAAQTLAVYERAYAEWRTNPWGAELAPLV